MHPQTAAMQTMNASLRQFRFLTFTVLRILMIATRGNRTGSRKSPSSS